MSEIVASDSELVTACLICCEGVDNNQSKHPDQVSEVLTDLFKILCKYMKWEEVPSRYEFSFDQEIFPFCKECRVTLVRLYRLDEEYEKVRKEIQTAIWTVSGKILLSKKEEDFDSSRNKDSGGSSQNDSLCLGTAMLQLVDKVNYYRNLIYRRYSPSVPLTVDHGLLLSAGDTNSNQDEHTYDAEVLGGNSSESESVGASDLELLVASKSNVESDAGKGRKRQEAKTDLDGVEKSKQTGTCDEGSEITISNRPRRSCAEKLKLRELISEGEEDFADGSQNDDTNYEPRNASNRSAHIGGNSSKNGVRNDGSSSCGGKDEESDEFRNSDEDQGDADSSDYENVREFPLPQSFTGKLPIPPLYIRRRKIRKKELGTHVFAKANETILNANKAVAETAAATVNMTGSDQEPTTRIPTEDQAKNTREDVIIRVESNIFPEYKGRIQKIGHSKYLLDDKISFECLQNQWRCISCEFACVKKDTLRKHIGMCPGDRPDDSMETLKFKAFTYDKLKDGTFQCRHCKHLLSSYTDDVALHFQRYHKSKSTRKVSLTPSWVELEPNKYLCEEKYAFELVDKIFKCGSCPATFPLMQGVLGHIQTRHLLTTPAKKIRLHTRKISLDKFTANEKFSFEKVDNEYSCCECIYSTPKLARIKEHMIEKHVDPEKFSCEQCDKKFYNKSHLQVHQTSHSDDRPFVCELCGKSFKTDHALKVHRGGVHLENSDKKFSCHVCGKGFRIRASLNAHMNNHERILCVVCGKQVKKTCLKQHMISHSGVNTFECPKCGKKYRQNVSLMVHLKSHDGAKPYSCDICDMRFTQRCSVSRHKNVVHNPNNNKKATKTQGRSRKRKHHKEWSSESEGTEEEEITEDNSNRSPDTSP